MTKLRYVGPHVAVEVPALETTVKRGDDVEVADEALAAALLEQETWEPAGGRRARNAGQQTPEGEGA